MHLGKLYSKFDRRCKSYSNRIEYVFTKKTTLQTWEFNYFTEVLISDIWQAWCHFSRDLLFSSCRGTVARDGSSIAIRPGDNSWKRLGYEAKQGIQGRSLSTNGHMNFAVRKEPTWGDLDVFIRAVTILNPSNSNNLITSYGSFHKIKDLQLTRNACAHKNCETISELRNTHLTYDFSNLKCSTELAWKTKRPDNDLAIEIWLHEMNLIADLSTSRA